MISALAGIVARSPWGIQALLYVVAALLIISIGLGVTVELQGARLDTAKAKTVTLTVQLKALGNQVAAQNAAVDQMLANAAIQHGRLQEAEKRAARIQVITEERVESVERAPIPVTCPEAVTWGAEHAIEIGKRWEGNDAVQ